MVGAKTGFWLGFTCCDGACRQLIPRILNGGGLRAALTRAHLLAEVITAFDQQTLLPYLSLFV